MKKRMALLIAAAMTMTMAIPAAASEDAEYTIALCAKTEGIAV